MLPIEIYSDLICPWCFIGKRRLDRVLAASAVPVQITWRAFQLRPGLPDDGLDRRQYLAQRYGEAADPGRLPERLAGEAEVENIAFAYERVERVPNTLLGHRLLAAAESVAGTLQHELADALFRAYFQQGLDVGDAQTLLSIAEAAGMDAQLAQQALTQERWLTQVQAELAAAREHDVSGVPCLIFAGRFSLPGVQADDVMLHFIERAAERLA
ncbi:MAG: DsbA family oxidoreductase [Pseudomonadales bacterium]